MLKECGPSPVLPGRLILSVFVGTHDIELLKAGQNNVIPVQFDSKLKSLSDDSLFVLVGKATALGDSSSPSKAATAVSAQATDTRTDQPLPDEAHPSSPIADDEEASDWDESSKEPKRRVPPKRGTRNAETPSKGSSKGNLRKAGPSTKGSQKRDRQQAAVIEDVECGSSEGEEWDGKGQQVGLAGRAMGPQGLFRGRNRKRQVII